MRGWGSLAVTLALAGTPAFAANCKFIYSDQVRTDVIRPMLERLKALDWDTTPNIRVKHDIVELVFDNRRMDLIDCPWIRLVLGDCGKTFLRADSAFPTPGSPWRPMYVPAAR